MNVPSLHASTYQSERNARPLPAATLVALAVAVLAACGGGGGSGGQMATPTFSSLQIPDPSGSSTWTTFPTSPSPAEVLPTRGRGVRVLFSAPVGSVFAVSLRDLSGAVTTLTENMGSPPPPDTGYFQIVSEDPQPNPPIYTMYVRAPMSLADQLSYDVLVVNRSLRTDMADSNAMVVQLRRRRFTVTVTVNGAGHVTSNPAGIQCGTAFSGAALTQCSNDFGPSTGPVQVTLNPNSNDPTVTRFRGWAGDCAPNVQSCVLTLDGTVPAAATGTFEARTIP